MAQMKCPSCNKLVSTSDSKCPHCESELQSSKIIPPSETTQKNNKTGYIIGAIVVFLILGISSAFVPDEENSSSRSSTVSVVKNLPWDNSVIPVKNYIKNNLKDPSSLEFISWGNVIKTADGTYVVNVKYRAKNSFGGFVVNDQIFTMSSSGDILKVNDY